MEVINEITHCTTADLTNLHKYGLLISGCSLTASISRKETYGN